MPSRRLSEDSLRLAEMNDIEHTYHDKLAADVRFKIRIHLAMQKGITAREISARLGIGKTTIAKWGREGERALAKQNQRDADPLAEPDVPTPQT